MRASRMTALLYGSPFSANPAINIEKWTLEKILTDQAMAELSSERDYYRARMEELHDQKNQLVHAVHQLGGHVTDGEHPSMFSVSTSGRPRPAIDPAFARQNEGSTLANGSNNADHA